VEAVVEAEAELVDPLRRHLAADVVAHVAVERGEHFLRVLESERQAWHLGHRHERPPDIAGHVELELALAHHLDHLVVGAEHARAMHLDRHRALRLGGHAIRHLLQADVVRAVERLAEAEPVAVRFLPGGAARERGRAHSGDEMTSVHLPSLS